MRKKAENHYIGKNVFFTWVKGGKLRSGKIVEIHGNKVVVDQGRSTNWLYNDEVWSNKNDAKENSAQ